MAIRRLHLYPILVLGLLMAALQPCSAQDSDPQLFRQGTHYIDLSLHSLDRFAQRARHTQARLLGRLARKERRYAAQLRHSDSAGYARYLEDSRRNPSFDSIRHLLNPDSAALAGKFSRKPQAAIDSLRGVAAFLQSKAAGLQSMGSVGGAAGAAGYGDAMGGYNARFGELQGRLNYQQYIDGLISTRSNSLQSMAGGSLAGVPAVGGIQKDLFYARSKIAAWKQVSEDPDKAEARALEYLEGREGFDVQMDKALNGGNPMSAAGGGGSLSATDLERMGYQVKRQVNAALQKQFGGNTAALQGQMGKQVSDWQDRAQGIGSGIKDAKATLAGLKNTQKPSFKINPMRGLPFWKRIEKSYSFTTQRAQSGRPAILDVAATAGYRFSPKLSSGLGLATDIGLGQGFSAIRISFEGVGLRSYAAWQWIWGIGAYGGYERVYRRAFFTAKGSEAALPYPSSSVHNTADYNESVVIGLTKTYHINTKYNGAVQVLWDVWWKEKGLPSPLLIRFTTQTK